MFLPAQSAVHIRSGGVGALLFNKKPNNSIRHFLLCLSQKKIICLFSNTDFGNCRSNLSVSILSKAEIRICFFFDYPKAFYRSFPPCLSDGEIADYKIKKIDEYYGETQIVVKDEKSGADKFSFDIQNVRLSAHPIEIHKCGAYLIREFNINYAKSEFLPNFNYALWKYDYIGNSTKLIILAERKGDQKLVIYYSTEFRIAPAENYLSLIRGSLGRVDYTLIIKDLNTLKDIFILPIAEIKKQKPEMVNDIEFQGWTKDSRYLWLDTHYGANILGYIRIDSVNWKVDYFLSPKDVLGGDAFNTERGLITVHPGNVWFGISELDEQEKEKRRTQGIGTELYIENLFTHNRQFVASTTEPLWYFKPNWLSDTELQYELPTGEKKIYVVK